MIEITFIPLHDIHKSYAKIIIFGWFEAELLCSYLLFYIVRFNLYQK